MIIKSRKPQSVASATMSQSMGRGIFAPGNRFGFDLFQQLSFTSRWQMPIIKGETLEAPSELTAFYREGNPAQATAWRHFYTDDRRLMPFLTSPYQMADTIARFPVVTGIDISLKPEMPLPMQLQASFWNKLITAFWQHRGMTVMQNVVWGSECSYDFCFEGYAKNAVVAVNSTGVGRDKRSAYLWDKGYEAMLEALTPTLIIRYGAKRPGERTDISVYYENDNKKAARHGR